MMVGLTVAVNAAGLLYGPLVVLRQEENGESWLEALVPSTLLILALPHAESEQWERLAERHPAEPGFNLTQALSSTSSGGGAMGHPSARLQPVYMMNSGSIFGRRASLANGYSWRNHQGFLEHAPHGLLGFQNRLIEQRLIHVIRTPEQSVWKRGTALLWLGNESAGLSLQSGEALLLLNEAEPHLRGVALQVISESALADPQILDRLMDWLDPQYPIDPPVQREEAKNTLFNLGLPAAERLVRYLQEEDSANVHAWEVLMNLACDSELPEQSQAAVLFLESEAAMPAQSRAALSIDVIEDVFWVVEGSSDPLVAELAAKLEKRLAE
ncbi:MAG: hypothetical protein AAF593_04685 [Planctomycetota bacterium]